VSDRAHEPEKVIIDTDIGDDLDDAYALALALSMSKLDIIGVTTAWGDTDLRARLVARLLSETRNSKIPVAAGPKTKAFSTFSQERWAEVWPEPANGWPDAIDFIRDAVHRYPRQITLIAVAPLSNVGALIHKDPEAFQQLKRVVLMGGSIRQGYGDLGYAANKGPVPEYNIKMDIASAKELFASRVPIYVMPLDSTQLKLDEVMRSILFGRDSRMTNALAVLYSQWTASTQVETPTLYDAMAVAAISNPGLCPTQPLHLEVDEEGYTRVTDGIPNANVCLESNSDRFFHFYLPALLNWDGRKSDAVVLH
jgi:inosine-uridine nucleoside N-ribohydrolase